MKHRRTRLLFLLLVCVILLKVNVELNPAAAHESSHQPIHTLTGDIRFHKQFHSRFLPTDRDLIVYLPPDYERDHTKRYPVLYMQDGQNIFDVATCFWPGFERHFDERAEYLIAKKEIQPLIIVGIYSTELERINEYTPTPAVYNYRGGDANLYARMLVEEIKPFIDCEYRTLPSRENTGLGGAWLGGLVSMYIGLKYPETFGKLAVSSPAAYWDDEMIVQDVKRTALRKLPKVFLSVGRGEPNLFVSSTRDLHQALESNGWRNGANLAYFEPPVSEHRPGAWTSGVDLLLEFLFPGRKPMGRR